MRAVAVGLVARTFALAQPAFAVFLNLEHLRREFRALVRPVAERLFCRFSAGAEEIFFARAKLDFNRLGRCDFRFRHD